MTNLPFPFFRVNKVFFISVNVMDVILDFDIFNINIAIQVPCFRSWTYKCVISITICAISNNKTCFIACILIPINIS